MADQAPSVSIVKPGDANEERILKKDEEAVVVVAKDEEKEKETPEQTEFLLVDENMAKRWMPGDKMLNTLATVNSEYITVETYQHRFAPEYIVMPRSLGDFVHWRIPLATVHGLLKQMDAIRKLWRMWWSPASAPGFTIDMLSPQVLSDVFGMHKVAGLPWVDAREVGAYEKLKESVPLFVSAAEKHERAMLAVTPKWMRLLESLRNADAAAIRQLRDANKANRASRINVPLNSHDPKSKRVPRWEKQLSEMFQKTTLNMNLDKAIPKYVSMEHPKLAEVMQTRLRASILGAARSWRTAALTETRQPPDSPAPADPNTHTDVTEPYIHRVRFWIDAECATNTLMVQLVEATAGPSGEDKFTRATFTNLVRAHELFMTKMRYLSRCASRADLGLPVPDPEARVKTMAFAPRPGSVADQQCVEFSTEESLFHEEAIAHALVACAQNPFDETSGAQPSLIKLVKEHNGPFPGTCHAWLETMLENDTKMLEAADLARTMHETKQKQKKADGEA